MFFMASSKLLQWKYILPYFKEEEEGKSNDSEHISATLWDCTFNDFLK